MKIPHSHKSRLDTTFAEWRKSSFSNPNGNQCVEVSFTSNAVGLRDSKDPDGTVLAFDHSAWTAFLARIATVTRG